MTNEPFLFKQSLDFDREGLIKMKKAIKSIYNNGIGKFRLVQLMKYLTSANSFCSPAPTTEQVESEQSMSKSLEKLGANAMSKDSEPDIGAAFIKFSIVTKELSSLMKALVSIT